MAKNFWHKSAYKLTEAEIRYAMLNTNSNREAAAFLHINTNTYSKYAKMYFDHETGKTLYELHNNKGGWHSKKPHHVSLEDIFNGKHPAYSAKKLHHRLLSECAMDECCNICGFNERRISDYSVPLVLTWKNGDKKDHSRDNLEFVCFNCYHLNYGDMRPRPYIILPK